MHRSANGFGEEGSESLFKLRRIVVSRDRCSPSHSRVHRRGHTPSSLSISVSLTIATSATVRIMGQQNGAGRLTVTKAEKTPQALLGHDGVDLGDVGCHDLQARIASYKMYHVACPRLRPRKCPTYGSLQIMYVKFKCNNNRVPI